MPECTDNDDDEFHAICEVLAHLPRPLRGTNTYTFASFPPRPLSVRIEVGLRAFLPGQMPSIGGQEAHVVLGRATRRQTGTNKSGGSNLITLSLIIDVVDHRSRNVDGKNIVSIRQSLLIRYLIC